MNYGLPLLRFTEWLRGSSALSTLDSLTSIPAMPNDELVSLRERLIRKLLRHAGRTVPYYEELMRSLSIDPDTASGADLVRLPVLTKGILRAEKERMRSTAYTSTELLLHRSGGSTGTPVEFWHDKEYIRLSDAATFRSLMQCGWEPGEMIAFFWGSTERLRRMNPLVFEVRQHLRRSYQFDPYAATKEEMDRWYRKWRRIRPRVVYGYASAIARFASFLGTEGRQLPPVKGVFTTAEKLYPHQRNVIQRAFNAPVFDVYGSSEVRNIAVECRFGRMHLQSDFVIAEHSVDRGADSQELVLTSLRSFGTPFIRYINGDTGSLSSTDCECGQGFPALTLDVARATDYFLFPNGRMLHGAFMTALMFGREAVETFLFHQVAPMDVRLHVVASSGREDEAVKDAGAAILELKRIAGTDLVAQVEMVEELPLQGAGKHRFVRSDVHDSLEDYMRS